MSTKGFAESVSIMRLAIIFTIISSAFGLFLLYRLDYMIHGDLYTLGNLQFSLSWALPMWTLERLLGVCFVLPMIYGAGVLVWDFLKRKKQVPAVKREGLPKPQSQLQPQPQPQPQSQSPPQAQPQPQLQPQLQRQPQQKQPMQAPAPLMPSSSNAVRAQALRENSMLISCPDCKKVFGKPLVMLDFSNKKTRLVNVCPYCNAVLGEARNEVEKEDVKIGTLDFNEKAEKAEKSGQ